MTNAAHASCDRASATRPRKGETVPHARLTLLTCILASSLAFIDGSVVNVGLPVIGGALKADPAGMQWVINAYLLPLSALLLAGGALGDLDGRRKWLIAGVAAFAAASVLCALAPDLSWLLAGRALQGLASAILLPNSLALLGGAFEGEARGRAIGVWAGVGAAVSAAGPLLGGWLIDRVGWRPIFYINAPVALGAIGLALLFVRDSRDQDRPPLDLAGMGFATAGLGAVTWALTIGSGKAGIGPISAAWFVAGAAALLAFVWSEHRRGEKAMLPVALFGSRDFVGLSLWTFLLYGALGGLLVLAPYVLIEAGGYSATAAGAALLPFPVILALSSTTMGQVAAKVGPRLPLSIGPLGVAAGFALMVRLGDHPRYWTELLPALLVVAIGMAGAVAPLTTAVLASVDQRHTGVASGFNSAVARTGGLIGTALLGGVLSAHGEALMGAFRAAAVVAAVASLGAAASAFFLISPHLRADAKKG
jgi:EmrB/QacA subfamily drug resistance transporter